MLHRSTRVKSLREALAEFLRAPAARGGSNEDVVVHVMGVKGIHVIDPPTFDAVRLRYEKPVRTFEEAFYACWNGRRDWLRFDLRTLQECDGGDFQALQLPQRIERAIILEEEAQERAAIAGEPSDREEFLSEPSSAPPLELLRRHPARGKASVRELDRTYRAAKRNYHRIGKALCVARGRKNCTR